MSDAWITDTMPPTAGVYDVTIQVVIRNDSSEVPIL